MTATGDRRTHARHDRACCLFTWGPRHGPQTPIARRAPAEPGRASVTVVGDGGPEMAPKPPIARRAPGGAGARFYSNGGPDMAPKPPSLVAPRRSRARLGHSRRCWGPRDGPQTPIARRAPAEPGRASVTVVGAGGPEMAPNPHRSSPPAAPGGAAMAPQPPIARRAPAEPGRASVTVVGAGGPETAPKPPIARRAAAEPGRVSISVYHSPPNAASRRRCVGT